jgi:Beta-glucosidase/6-phospho-beta-glucosidase/beta-galactosidase
MSLLNRVKSLPNGFVWGGATAAYQVEGSTKVAGKGKTMWDDYLKAQGRFSPDPASDFYNRYPEDIALSKKYGLNSIRVSIAWTRIFPKGYGEPNQEGVAYYHRLFKECLDRGLEPYVSLHHFDSPQTLFEDGDWLNRKNIDYFVDYAEFCF